MLKRLYVNNYRGLVNFEHRFDELTLLLGPNGSGKSTILDCLDSLKRFLTQKEEVLEVFPWVDFTCWVMLDIPVQIFELEIEGDGGIYFYRLVVEHNPKEKKARMKEEILNFNDNPLFSFQGSEAKLYRDDFSSGPSYRLDWSKSGVGWIEEGRDNARLIWFQDWMKRFLVVQLQPKMMNAEFMNVGQEVRTPQKSLKDFSAWYSFLLQERQGQIIHVVEKMRDIIPGFDSFFVVTDGKMKTLCVKKKGQGSRKWSLEFSQLSDGQRALIALYTIVLAFPEEGGVVCIDEPENYMALPEIQPWFYELERWLQQEGTQAIIISHHPRVVNFLAKDAGYWMEQEYSTGPVRIKKINLDIKEGGMTADELVERGWLFDGDVNCHDEDVIGEHS